MATVEFDGLGRFVLAGRGTLNALLLNAVLLAGGATVVSSQPQVPPAGDDTAHAPAIHESTRSITALRSLDSRGDAETAVLEANRLMQSAIPVPGNKINAMCVC